MRIKHIFVFEDNEVVTCHCLLYVELFLYLAYRKLLAFFKEINDHDTKGVRDSLEQFAHVFKLINGKGFGSE